MIRILPLLYFFLAAGAIAQPFSAIPRATNFAATDLLLIETNSAGSAGQRFVRAITASDLLSQAAGIRVGAEVFVDASIGSDNTGVRGRPDKPFATPYVAKLAAQSNDAIIVHAGTYATRATNLFFNGEWFFENCLLRFIDVPTNTAGWGMFDDRFSGAVNCGVHGVLWMQYNSGTNVSVNSADCTLGYNTNSLGAIVQTNPATYIRWDADTLCGIAGPAPAPFAITALHGVSNSYYRRFEIYNLNPSNTTLITTNCPADPGTPYFLTTGANGIHWGDVDMVFEGNIRAMTEHAFWGDNLTTNANQIWLHGQVCDGNWYVVGRTNQWKIWAEFDEFMNTQNLFGSDLFDIWNCGAHYFNGKKVSSKTGTVLGMQNPDSGQTDKNLNVWVNFDKLSGSNSWMNIRHGWLHGRIGEFQQNGPNNGSDLVNITNATALVSLSGETMNGANTIITHGGGVSEWHSFAIRSTNRDPIKVMGSGLKLDVYSIDTGATNAMRASSAQIVTLMSPYNGPGVDANITFAGTNRAPTLVVDRLVKPLLIATNYGVVTDDGSWELLLNEEWISNPASVAGAVGNHPWTTATAGTLPLGLANPIIESNAWSIISMVTTQTTSGRMLACPSVGAATPTGFVLTNCEYFFEARIRMNSTNLTGDVSTTRIGMSDSAAANGEFSNGIYIMNNTNVNTNSFILVTARGGTRTYNYSTLGTYGNMTWQTVGFYFDRTGTNVVAFVGPDRFRFTSFATNNANLPGDTVLVGCSIQNDRMASTGGLNFRTNYCDYAKLWVRRFL